MHTKDYFQASQEKTDQKIDSIYPIQFLGFLSERLKSTFEKILILYKVPEQAIQALDNLQYIQILINSDPEKWRPQGRQGYEIDLKTTIEEMIWQISKLDKLSSEYIHQNYDGLSQSEIPPSIGKSGWEC